MTKSPPEHRAVHDGLPICSIAGGGLPKPGVALSSTVFVATLPRHDRTGERRSTHRGIVLGSNIGTKVGGYERRARGPLQWSGANSAFHKSSQTRHKKRAHLRGLSVMRTPFRLGLRCLIVDD